MREGLSVSVAGTGIKPSASCCSRKRCGGERCREVRITELNASERFRKARWAMMSLLSHCHGEKRCMKWPIRWGVVNRVSSHVKSQCRTVLATSPLILSMYLLITYSTFWSDTMYKGFKITSESCVTDYNQSSSINNQPNQSLWLLICANLC